MLTRNKQGLAALTGLSILAICFARTTKIEVPGAVVLANASPPFVIEGEIPISNKSLRSIDLTIGAASCGCLAFEKREFKLKPLSTIDVPFQFDGSSMGYGVYEAHIILLKDGVPMKPVRIISELQRSISVSPQKIVLYPDSAMPQSVRVIGEELQSVLVVNKPNYVNFEEIQKVDGGSFVLSITIDKGQVGNSSFFGNITLRVTTLHDVLLKEIKVIGTL